MILIVLPAYNEGKNLCSLLPKIRKEMTAAGFEYAVLIVNDGSVDDTGSVVREFAGHMPVILIEHRLNRGLGETIRDAFEKAAEMCRPEDVIVRMDADDTHDPKYVVDMVRKMEEGYDIVVASRFLPTSSSRGLTSDRELTSRAANLLMRLCFPIPGVRDYSNGFRAYRAGLIRDAISIYRNDFIELKGLGFTGTVEKLVKLRRFRIRMAEVPFELRYDLKQGESKMFSRLTILGYLVLIVKNIYPWGKRVKGYIREIEELERSATKTRVRAS